MAPRIRMEGHGEVLVLSSNNYLGLANHPEVIAAGVAGLRAFGAGTASVRFICGTLTAHRDLEQGLARFLGTEAALSYVSCWNANTGLLPVLAGDGDTLISDELNHASIIDACRLTGKGVERRVYRHGDMQQLAEILKESAQRRARIVVTDGVFSMEGDLAPLPDLVTLCQKHDALLVVDDSHGLGVLGKRGAGTAEHFGLAGKIDVITGTLGKALGGAAGGFVAGPSALVDHLFQKSRPLLFSNALPATVAASALKALEVLERDPGLLARLRENTRYFREKLLVLGFAPLPGESAIIPILIGATAKAMAVSQALLKRRVFVTGFGYPVVPEGKARIRIQMCAAFTRADLDEALAALKEVKAELGL